MSKSTSTMKQETAETKVVEEVAEIMKETAEANPGLARGLANLKRIKVYDESNWQSVPFSDFARGTVAFRGDWDKGIKVAVAGGKAQQRHISPPLFVSMVEAMGESVLLQNFTDRDDKQSARGQILGMINPKHSAIIIWQGLAGRVINGYNDVALQEVYYLGQDELASTYLACKFQVANIKRLDELAAANQGWKTFNIPTDLNSPYGARV